MNSLKHTEGWRRAQILLLRIDIPKWYPCHCDRGIDTEDAGVGEEAANKRSKLQEGLYFVKK
jgi:hypothetical protein